MRAKTTQLSVVAVAALAVFAVAAVMLLAGGGSAQAGTASLAPDSGGGHLLPMTTDPTPTPTPRFPLPEPCPGEEGNTNALDNVVDSGHIALFDVWWNTDEGELTNTSCPPTITHTREERLDEEGEGTGEYIDTYTRSPSSINIEETVIHIPNSAKIDLSAAGTPYTQTKYPELWAADDGEDINGSGIGDRLVWRLPGCPPEGPSDSVMCLSFSAALLNDADWNGNIVYHVDHVHQIDIDKQDPRYTLAYEEPAAGATGKNDAIWNSHNARVAMMNVAPGGYEQPMWFFTSRGTYEFQVHITGMPEKKPAVLGNLKPVADEDSVSSDVREYIVHVGAEADLSVGVTAEPDLESPDTTLDPGDDVTITITASNAGPDTAPDTKVAVMLPDGLSHSTDTTKAPNPSTGTYDSATGVWAIGDLAVTNDDNTVTTDDSPTLTITATVAEGTKGTVQKVKATISATETITTANDTYVVPVLDPDPGNNMGMDTVTVVTMPNVDPMFMVERSVEENSAVGTTVGAPIMVMEPDTGDTLTYTLKGAGSDHFGVNAVAGGAQIVVKQHSAGLNYEDAQSYKLVLCVSDGKDADGNPDAAVDHTIGVKVKVTDVANESLAVAVEADLERQVINRSVRLTPTVTSSPVASSQLEISWDEVNSDSTDSVAQIGVSLEPRDFTYKHPATRHYTVGAAYLDENQRTVHASAQVTVVWHNPS